MKHAYTLPIQFSYFTIYLLALRLSGTRTGPGSLIYAAEWRLRAKEHQRRFIIWIYRDAALHGITYVTDWCMCDVRCADTPPDAYQIEYFSYYAYVLYWRLRGTLSQTLVRHVNKVYVKLQRIALFKCTFNLLFALFTHTNNFVRYKKICIFLDNDHYIIIIIKGGNKHAASIFSSNNIHFSTFPNILGPPCAHPLIHSLSCWETTCTNARTSTRTRRRSCERPHVWQKTKYPRYENHKKVAMRYLWWFRECFHKICQRDVSFCGWFGWWLWER